MNRKRKQSYTLWIGGTCSEFSILTLLTSLYLVLPLRTSSYLCLPFLHLLFTFIFLLCIKTHRFPWGFSGTMLAIALFFIAFVQGTRSIDDIIACVFPGIKAAAVFPAPSLSVEEHVGEYVAQGMVNFPTYIGLGFGCLVGFIGFTRTKMINAETMKIPEPKDDGTTNMSNQELIAAIFKQNQLIVQYMQQQHRNGDGKNGTPPPPPHLGNNTQIIPMSEGYNSTDKTEVENLRAIRLEHGADSEEYRQAANNLHE